MESMDESYRIFEELGNLEPDMEMSEAAFASVSEKLGMAVSSRPRKYGRVLGVISSIAACLFIPALASALFLALRPAAEAPEWVEVYSGEGETKEIGLCDGTVLKLKPQTRVTYPSIFSGKDRHIFMDGEITAEVAKDSLHPFIISAGTVSVRVLGTRFNLKNYSGDDNVEVLLANGRINLEVPSDGETREIIMTPGDLVQYDKLTGEMDISNYSADMVEGLEDGSTICYNNLKMEDIARDLERRFGVRIVLRDEKLSNTRFFAIFNHAESTDAILSALAANSKMVFDARDGIFYLSSKK